VIAADPSSWLLIAVVVVAIAVVMVLWLASRR
jgi:uncharacterized membrane protein YqiK